MGRESSCICEWNGDTARVKALLEPPELILRGEIRRRIPLASMQRVAAAGGKLCFNSGGDTFCLVLGNAVASKWAKALLTPPPSLAKKLGIVQASTVRMIGTIDDEALRESLAIAKTVVRGKASLILARINTPEELRTALKKSADLCAEGVPLWIIYRKGPGHPINESDVRSSGLAEGIVDIKVASVSAQLTALKFVKRRNPSAKKSF